MKRVSKVVMVIMGTLIGAGFASGREIYVFFSQYGHFGLLGILLSSFLTALIIYLVLKQVKEKNMNHYASLLTEINPNHQKINFYLHGIVNSFLLISFFIMIAGFSAYMKQEYAVPIYVSSLIFVLFCYLVFQKSLQGMMKVNSYLVPFLLLFLFYLGVKNFPYLIETKLAFYTETKQVGFLFSSILYTSYNSIILIPVLVSMKHCCDTKKEIVTVSTLCGISMLILSFSIYGLLLKGQFFVHDLELPLLQITLELGKVFQYLYGFVIICSIFTSAIATGYSFLENVSKNKKEYHRNLIFICVVGVFVSNFGFSNLVQIVYPFFGVLGLLQIVLLLKKPFSKNYVRK